MNDFVTLGKYAKVQGGYAYKSKDFSDHGKLPVIKIKNVRFGYVDYSDTNFINAELAQQSEDWQTEEGDILISMTGSGPNAPQSLVGRVARVWGNEPKSYINQRVGRLILFSKDEIDPDFLFYLLNSPESQDFLLANSTGSANQANISGKTIEALPCPEINYTESKAIAKILRDLDLKILNNRKTNETLEAMAQAIFKSWFVDFEPTRAKIAAIEAGEDPELAAMAAISGKPIIDLSHLTPEQTQQLKSTAALFPITLQNSELGEIPEGWEVGTIDEVTSLIIDHRGKTPKKLGGEWSLDGYPAISAKNIKSGKLTNKDQIRYLKEDLYTKWMKEPIQKGDVLITSEGPLGEMFYIQDDTPYCLSQRLYGLRANPLVLSASYFYLSLQTPRCKCDLESRSTGTTVVGILQSELKKVSLIVPNIKLTNLFEQRVSPIFGLMQTNENSNDISSSCRDRLLPELLTGRMSI